MAEVSGSMPLPESKEERFALYQKLSEEFSTEDTIAAMFMPDKKTLEEWLFDQYEKDISITEEKYKEYVSAYKAQYEKVDAFYPRLYAPLREYYNSIADDVIPYIFNTDDSNDDTEKD